jgi:Fe-S-cluster containining protein
LTSLLTCISMDDSSTKVLDDSSQPASLLFDLSRSSPFSFKCQVCSACCHNKAIRIAPYEALRLARNLGLTTTEFFQVYVEKEGLVLRLKPDGSCVFLKPEGCGVHHDRPLVCRLFPLGQIIDKDGRERFAVMPLHPDCLGLLGSESTVEAYLESQEVDSYFYYDKCYSALHKKMLETLRRALEKEKIGPGETEGGIPASEPGDSPFLLSSWLDIDATVKDYAKKKGLAKPESFEALVKLHIEAIEEWLTCLQISFRPVPGV